MPPAIQKELEKLLAGQERMPVRTILKKLQAVCRKTGASLPARASLYHFMAGAPTPEYHPSTLPQGAKNALYNLAPDVPVPGHQLAFYCFNYGDLEALHFASGLPWLSLYQASLMRGFRAKSRGLLEAVLRARGIIRKGENKS